MVHSRCCRVLQVISGDIDGIIHLRGVRVLVLFVLLVLRGLLYQVMRLSQRAVYTYYFINIFTETKKYSCNTFLWVILCSTRFEHAEYDYEEVE